MQKLVGAAYDNPLLRDRLGVRDAVTFEAHTNLGTADCPLSESRLAASMRWLTSRTRR